MATTSANADLNAAWDTARDAVRAGADELRSMSTHTELFQWAKDHHLDTKSLFPKYKTELRKQLHIDYDALRAATMAARAEELTAAAAAGAPTIDLCVAGDSEVSAFAVCNADGGDPWYGDFHDRDRVTDQDSADLAAAGKAVYLAGQARADADLPVVVLTMTTSNHAVSAQALRREALRARVHVVVNVVDRGEDNPALEVCRLPGYRSWREVSLTDLLTDPAIAQES